MHVTISEKATVLANTRRRRNAIEISLQKGTSLRQSSLPMLSADKLNLSPQTLFVRKHSVAFGRVSVPVAAMFCIALASSAIAQSRLPAVHAAGKDATPVSSVLLDTMTGELQRAFTSLGKPGPNQKD